MKIIPISFEILGKPNASDMLANIEAYGRVCCKSEDSIACRFLLPVFSLVFSFTGAFAALDKLAAVTSSYRNVVALSQIH